MKAAFHGPVLACQTSWQLIILWLDLFSSQGCRSGKKPNLCESTSHSPDVDERRLPAATTVAQEQLGALQAAVVEVGRLPAVGAVDAGEAFGHRLSGRAVDDGQVGDRRLGPAGLGL